MTRNYNPLYKLFHLMKKKRFKVKKTGLKKVSLPGETKIWAWNKCNLIQRFCPWALPPFIKRYPIRRCWVVQMIMWILVDERRELQKLAVSLQPVTSTGKINRQVATKLIWGVVMLCLRFIERKDPKAGVAILLRHLLKKAIK